MKRKTIFYLIASLYTGAAFAQEKFNLVTFTAPQDWTKETSPKGDAVRYTIEEAENNAFAMITIFKSIPASADSKANFDTAWDELAFKTMGAGSPEMQAVAEENGWVVETGVAPFQKEGIEGVALLITASGANQMVNVLFITNTDIFQNEVENFFSSVNLPPLKSQTANTPNPQFNPNGSPTVSLSGSVRDYEFVVPPTWTRQDLENETVLRKTAGDADYIISFQPFVVSGGNLETDAERLFWQVFDGWQAAPAVNYFSHEKGITKQGLDYFLIKKFITRHVNGTNLQRDGFILLVQAGDQVIVISASQPMNDIANLAGEALNFILFDFGITGLEPADFQQELLGTWSSASSSVGAVTSYHPDNTFSTGGSVTTRTSRDAFTDIITTSGFDSEGNYVLNGNVLTKNFTKTKVTHGSKIRFYYTKTGDGDWVAKMGSQSITVGGFDVFTKD